MLAYSGSIYDKDAITASEKATDTMVDTGNGRGMPPADFARRVIEQISRPKPPYEIVIGTDDWMFKYIQPYLPTWVWRRMITKSCGTSSLTAAAS
jgi:hypothetical protein